MTAEKMDRDDKICLTWFFVTIGGVVWLISSFIQEQPQPIQQILASAVIVGGLSLHLLYQKKGKKSLKDVVLAILGSTVFIAGLVIGAFALGIWMIMLGILPVR